MNRNSFLLLVVFSLLLVVSACKPSPDKAKEYYNLTLDYQQIVLEKEDVLIRIINSEMKKTLADSANANIPQSKDTVTDDSQINAAYADFCAGITQSIAKLKELGPFDGKTQLYDPAMKLLELYKKLSENEYKQVVEIVKIPSSLYSNEDDNRFLDLTEHIDTCLQGSIDEYTRACKEFAREYKFEITEPNQDINNN